MTIPFLISNSPEMLAAVLKQYERTSTVEAEYGDVVVKGTLRTLAHHGPRADQLCPCLWPNLVPERRPDVVGGSHFDLDSLGGYLAECGLKPDAPGFWELAAFVDTKGPHRISECGGAAQVDIDRLYAYWAWAAKPENRLNVPRDGSVADASELAIRASNLLHYILQDDPTLLAEGQRMQDEQRALNIASLLYAERGVAVRKSDKFVNHLYEMPMGFIGKAVVALNTTTKAITVSFERPLPGFSCRAIVQALWGPLAGGHDGIAGSPRGQEMTEADLANAAEYVIRLLS